MRRLQLLRISIFTTLLTGGVADVAGAYRVFDWQGKAAPVQPTEGPPGAGAVTHTSYLNGGQYWEGSGLMPMDVEMDITVSIWDTPTKWKVDPEGFVSGGNPANYGYQTPDEAEFNFGDPNAQVVMRFDILFGQPINNPSFLLMDIDNSGGDRGSFIQATTADGGTVFPSMSLVTGSTVAWTGSGSTFEIFSNGGAANDDEAVGSAFFEWEEKNVTGISFTWESNNGTSIRVSNIYSEFNPPNFNVVPEPSAALLALLFAGGLLLRRRR